MIPRLLSLYIAKRFANILAIILAAFGVIAFMVDYLTVLRRFADNEEFTGLVGLSFTAMRIPIVLDVLLPFVFLFGAVISLIGLSRKSEFVVARASGLSVWEFLRGPFAVALLFGVMATMIFNPLAVVLKHRANQLEATLEGRAPRDKGYWFRQQGDDGQSIVHAGSASEDGRTLFGVTAFVFTGSGEFHERVVAPRAEFAGDRWTLADSSVLSAVSRRDGIRYELPTRLSAEGLKRTFLDPQALSVWSLPAAIDTAADIGQDPDPFRLAFHALLNRPLMLLAMVLIAATVSLRLTRFGGMWKLVSTGAALGFFFYIADGVLSDFGRNGVIDPVLAAWLLPMLALTFGATALLYQEDG